MSKGFASNYRIFLIAAGIMLCLGGIGTRLVFLHVIDRGKLLGYVEKVRHQVIVEHARRGAIYDAHGYLLATNQSKYMVGVDPQAVTLEDRKKWMELASLIEMPLDVVEQKLTTKFKYLLLNNHQHRTWLSPLYAPIYLRIFLEYCWYK